MIKLLKRCFGRYKGFSINRDYEGGLFAVYKVYHLITKERATEESLEEIKKEIDEWIKLKEIK